MISHKMQNLVKNSSVIRAMFEEGNRLAKLYGPENVFDFSIGNPSVTPPKQIRTAITDILNEENPLTVHGYMNNSGYEDVRQTIAEHINHQHGTAFSAQNIVMTCGAAGGLNVILKTLLNPEDEVIVFAPFFSEYTNYVQNFDGKLVIVQEGAKKKFVNQVEHITFSGKYAVQVKQPVLYITERAVFELRPEGVTLIEIAPGIDLQTQVLDQMEFMPKIAEDLKLMDERIFKDELMGLAEA